MPLPLVDVASNNRAATGMSMVSRTADVESRRTRVALTGPGRLILEALGHALADGDRLQASYLALEEIERDGSGGVDLWVVDAGTSASAARAAIAQWSPAAEVACVALTADPVGADGGEPTLNAQLCVESFVEAVHGILGRDAAPAPAAVGRCPKAAQNGGTRGCDRHGDDEAEHVSGPQLVIADCVPLTRSAIGRALVGDRVRVVGEAASAAELIEVVRRRQPDVVMADERLPGAGPSLWGELRLESTARVLVLAGQPDRGALLAALEGGPDGYLLRESPLSEGRLAVRKVLEGETYVPPGMLGLLLRELISRRRDEDAVLERFGHLSRREREVLALIVEGASHQQMAQALFLSAHTSAPTSRT